MSFYDLYSPILRHKYIYLLVTLILTFLGYHLVNMVVPDTQKTTLYFSVKPASTPAGSESSLTLDPLESSMKVAEMISGWAKDPSFRKNILREAGVEIKSFKKKISAKKQNRANVFWNLKLIKKEQIHQAKVIEGVKMGIRDRLDTFNQDNQYPFAITPIEESIDYRVIPFSWRLSACLILALILSHLILFFMEISQGRISFTHQIRQIFPHAPVFVVSSERDGNQAWDHFLEKTGIKESVIMFEGDEPFEVKTKASGDTTLLLISLGQTSLKDLENTAAAYGGEKVAILVLS